MKKRQAEYEEEKTKEMRTARPNGGRVFFPDDHFHKILSKPAAEKWENGFAIYIVLADPRSSLSTPTRHEFLPFPAAAGEKKKKKKKRRERGGGVHRVKEG